MTQPKKWYLQSDNNPDNSVLASNSPVQLVLFNKEGPIKKPNALRPLGSVKNVSVFINYGFNFDLIYKFNLHQSAKVNLKDEMLGHSKKIACFSAFHWPQKYMWAGSSLFIIELASTGVLNANLVLLCNYGGK